MITCADSQLSNCYSVAGDTTKEIYIFEPSLFHKLPYCFTQSPYAVLTGIHTCQASHQAQV